MATEKRAGIEELMTLSAEYVNKVLVLGHGVEGGRINMHRASEGGVGVFEVDRFRRVGRHGREGAVGNRRRYNTRHVETFVRQCPQ